MSDFLCLESEVVIECESEEEESDLLCCLGESKEQSPPLVWGFFGFFLCAFTMQETGFPFGLQCFAVTVMNGLESISVSTFSNGAKTGEVPMAS